MPSLTQSRIVELLAPFVCDADVPATLYPRLGAYLDLLIRWNGRTNLTAIREPEEIVQRHFGESVFAALELRKHLPAISTLLDFGSGAGFPGLPIQLVLPELRVTLAESQGKKAAFLREAVRVLGQNTSLWARRVEEMPQSLQFDVVTLRAVDKMDQALAAARDRVAPGGKLLVLGGSALAESFPEALVVPVPSSEHRRFILA